MVIRLAKSLAEPNQLAPGPGCPVQLARGAKREEARSEATQASGAKPADKVCFRLVVRDDRAGWPRTQPAPRFLPPGFRRPPGLDSVHCWRSWGGGASVRLTGSLDGSRTQPRAPGCHCGQVQAVIANDQLAGAPSCRWTGAGLVGRGTLAKETGADVAARHIRFDIKRSSFGDADALETPVRSRFLSLGLARSQGAPPARPRRLAKWVRPSSRPRCSSPIGVEQRAIMRQTNEKICSLP